jgi:YVTN family beta-propeller protein
MAQRSDIEQPALSGPPPARPPSSAGSLARHHSRRELRRRRLAWAVVVLLALALIGAGIATSRTTTTPSGTTAVAVTSPNTATSNFTLSSDTLLRLGAASSVTAVAEGDGAAFALDAAQHRLVEFDPVTGRAGRSVTLGSPPASMLLNGHDLWVSEPSANAVIELNASTLRQVRSVSVASGPTNLAVLDGDLWATSSDRLSIVPIALGTGTVGTTVDVLSGAVDLASGSGVLWATGTANRLTEITPFPASDQAPAEVAVKVGNQPVGVAVAAGSVWVANSQSGTVSEVDPTKLAVTKTLRVGTDPTSVTVGADGRIYVGLQSSQSLKVLTVAGSSKTLALTTHPQDLLLVGSGVWVAGATPGRVIAVSSS